MPDGYFDERAVPLRLFWTIATRRQLDRWELLVAANLRSHRAGGKMEGPDVWAGAIERHFVLVAAHHLLTALKLSPSSRVPVDQVLEAELEDGRHLVEHWDEQMPVLLRRGRNLRLLDDPKKSGKRFHARNPTRHPYGWWNWRGDSGPMLLPNVPATALRELLDAVEAEVLAADERLRRFVPPREPSAWLGAEGEWSPKPEASAAPPESSP